MYDAKEKELLENNISKDSNLTNSICISDRNYFNNKIKAESITNTKTSYIPRENLFE